MDTTSQTQQSVSHANLSIIHSLQSELATVKKSLATKVRLDEGGLERSDS